MSTIAVVLWLANILLDTVGQLAFKTAAIASDDGEHLAYWVSMGRLPSIWLGVACFVLKILLWLAFLSMVSLSEGVLLGSINIVAIMIAGHFLFKEKLSPLRMIGILLVASGVAIVGAF